YIAAFQARLYNLAAAHDLLIQAAWGPVMLDQLAEKTLSAIGIRDRVDLTASGVVLGPHDTQTVALALHELGTNAITYAALRNTQGRVSLRCDVDIAARGPEPATLIVRWEESGGPKVCPPNSKGFGITLLERLGRRQPQASVLDWRSGGLHCHIRLNLTP